MSDQAKAERRVVTGRLELRKAAGATPQLVGYAAKFGVRSENLGGFVELIAPAAFDRALREAHDVRLLINHDGVPLARSTSGTLRLSVDAIGLRIEADLPETQAGHDIGVSTERGDIDQMSFAFRTLGDEWNFAVDPVERTLTDLELLDVSVVTFPAYPQTEVALRSLEAARAATAPPEPPVERLAREARWHELAPGID